MDNKRQIRKMRALFAKYEKKGDGVNGGLKLNKANRPRTVCSFGK